eukprot:944234-Pyramimonas_sp.AAC.1
MTAWTKESISACTEQRCRDISAMSASVGRAGLRWATSASVVRTSLKILRSSLRKLTADVGPCTPSSGGRNISK